MSCLFNFLMVFVAQKFLILMKSVFSFVDSAFGFISKKPLPTPSSSRFTAMFPLKSYTVLALIFGFLIYFELM